MGPRGENSVIDVLPPMSAHCALISAHSGPFKFLTRLQAGFFLPEGFTLEA
jgi:hypothetical protein